jgi:hypothetical protein
VAAVALLVAALTIAGAALLMRRARSAPRAAYGLALIGVAELTSFAALQRTSFDMGILRDAGVDRFVLEHPGDYRIYNGFRGNSAMLGDAQDVWGYDPLVPARYAELVARLVGQERRGASDFFNALPRLHPALRMLRLRYAFIGGGDRLEIIGPPVLPEPMPHVALLGAYTVAADAQDVLRQVATPGWDPTRTAVLESEPRPRPEPHPDPGAARVVESSTDALTIEADLVAPAILLVTDAYSTYWRARALEGSSQSAYEVLPADYVLRAVPLGAGHHRMRMEYSPPHFRLAVWVSLAALALLGARRRPEHAGGVTAGTIRGARARDARPVSLCVVAHAMLMHHIASWAGTIAFLPVLGAILVGFDVAQRAARLIGQRPQEHVATALQMSIVGALRLCNIRVLVERAPGLRPTAATSSCRTTRACSTSRSWARSSAGASRSTSPSARSALHPERLVQPPSRRPRADRPRRHGRLDRRDPAARRARPPARGLGRHLPGGHAGAARPARRLPAGRHADAPGGGPRRARRPGDHRRVLEAPPPQHVPAPLGRPGAGGRRRADPAAAGRGPRGAGRAGPERHAGDAHALARRDLRGVGAAARRVLTATAA